MPRPVHFEIHAQDPERAKKFYESVFGWTIQKWDGPVDYWLITTGPEGEPGINGAIKRRVGPLPGDMAPLIAFPLTINVPSMDIFLEKVVSAGGRVVKEKMPIPGGGWHAYGKDTEGNVFGLMQNDPNAR